MFNLKKLKTMYLQKTNPFNSVLNTLLTSVSEVELSPAHSIIDIKELEGGNQKVTINAVGHNPKDISVDVTENEIDIKSLKRDDVSKFVKDIDFSLSLGTDYDGTKSTAKFEN